MVLEPFYLSAILLVYIPAFALPHVYHTFNSRSKAKRIAKKQWVSFLASVVIYAGLIVHTTNINLEWLTEIQVSNHPALHYTGYSIVVLGIGVGILSVLPKPFRSRLILEPPTHNEGAKPLRSNRHWLVLSNQLSLLGYLILFPSPVLLLMYLLVLKIYHQTILEEKAYMEIRHGAEYREYQKEVFRYSNLKQSVC